MNGDRGLTILELIISLSVVALIVLGLAASVLSTQRLVEDQGGRELAHRAAEEKINELIDHEYADVVDDYGSGSEGEWFEVPGLVPVDGEAAVGQVAFFFDETRNDDEATLFGLPRDLDGDGAATTTDVGKTPNVLPVRVRIRWQSSAGPAEVVVRHMLSPLRNE